MKLSVGKIVKAQGIKGEVKIDCYLDKPALMKKVRSLYVGTQCFKVVSMRVDERFCFALLDGVCDRNHAEVLVGFEVFADKESIELENETFFVEDVIDCKIVLDDGLMLGKVTEVLQYGSADVYVCKGEKEFSFPLLKDLVISIDISTKTIVLKKERFDEVVCYED